MPSRPRPCYAGGRDTLTLPITVLTLGLFLLVVNAVMLALAAYLVDGFEIKGFGAALLGSIALAVMNVLVGVLL